MSKSYKEVWIGQKDLNRDPKFVKSAQNEIQNMNLAEQLGSEHVAEEYGGSRRDFLKLFGFSLSAATIAAGCDIPIKRAIPYVVQPDEIVPGIATYYASSFIDGGDYCSVLVKTREGRPIKIEGNDISSITKGGTSARAQASVLSLYDVDRFRKPSIKDENGVFDASEWSELDQKVKNALQNASSVRILSNTVLSPSYKGVIEEFSAKYPDVKWVCYDPVSYTAMLDANEANFNDRVIPEYRFDEADIVVSFNADFLGTWLSPIEFAKSYAERRKISDHHNAGMSWHVQLESHMSLTGSNADNRILVKPSEQSAAVAFLYNQLTGANLSTGKINGKAEAALRKVATRLLAKRGKSIVVSGNNNIAEQILVNAINDFLGNYDSTLDFKRASLQRQGNEKELAALINEMQNGEVDVLLINNANPVYDHASGSDFAQALENVPMKVAMNYKNSETAALCDAIAPVHHYLESWGDVEAKRGVFSLIQPTISPLFDTRQAELSLLMWSESQNFDSASDQPYFEYLKTRWESNQFSAQSGAMDFQAFWDKTLHDGCFETEGQSNAGRFNVDINGLSSQLDKVSSANLEICFFETINIGNGQYSNNPWLQEMPDPVTRNTWGNYLAVPVGFDGVNKFLGMNNLEDGDIVELTVGDQSIKVPVIQQFGQMKGTVALALGYGRTNGGFAANGIGVDVNPLLTVSDGFTKYHTSNVSVSGKKGKEKHFSSVQYHHTMGVKGVDKKSGEEINADEAATVYAPYGLVIPAARKGFQGSLTERSVIRNAELDHLEEAVEELVHEREHFEELNQHSLYPFEEYSEKFYSQGHHWGMHVDLSACIGCGACTVACMAENNVPVVGKKQVSRHQEMAWIRIDRYFYGDAENPNTVYQPLMCQHCDNAPCENVCPVNATNHSSEGLNQMTYNRCIGTRYCANNCPYKVRRFNWMDYTTADLFPANQETVNGEETPYGADNLTRMVLNPDVTVRARGVIEKCSFCVQRIQEGKLTAKKEARKLHASDVKTACQTACPTGAISFGDRNDATSDFYKKYNSEMNYEVLEEVNTRPSVRYALKVINRDNSLDA